MGCFEGEIPEMVERSLPEIRTGCRKPAGRRVELGETTLQLQFRGVASSDPTRARAPLIGTFWILCGVVAAILLLFMCVRLTVLLG
jgi:hypothetical protein